ncbi:hypothetical protein ZWY2020_026923 [Hordeum vulgare]|nr:hypothetical protein ZWY2020_026923 [Hordeum vulgare]
MHVQRRAYADAVAVTGLRPLRLMHDLAATALCYGLYCSDLGVAGKPTFVAFVDVGHSDTQAELEILLQQFQLCENSRQQDTGRPARQKGIYFLNK